MLEFFFMLNNARGEENDNSNLMDLSYVLFLNFLQRRYLATLRYWLGNTRRSTTSINKYSLKQPTRIRVLKNCNDTLLSRPEQNYKC
jgi:hypothetical protein